MTTRELLNMIPANVRFTIENLRKDYSNDALDRDCTSARLAGYVQGLRDAGLISEVERRMLFVYGTI